MDVFGDVAVIASSAAWVEKYKQEIEFLVGKVRDVNHIKWRPSIDILKEEGLEISSNGEYISSSCPGRAKVRQKIAQFATYTGDSKAFHVIISGYVNKQFSKGVALNPSNKNLDSNQLFSLHNSIHKGSR